MFKKTRIAPTPSGYLHLGNAYSFALTAALAKRTGAKVLLRIDDLDRDRVAPEYVEDLFETLRFLKIPWDEGPASSREFEEKYSQRHRLELYRGALRALTAGDSVFACICSRAQLSSAACTCKEKGLPLHTPDAAWRLDTSKPRHLEVRVWPGNGAGDSAIQTILPEGMQDFIVRKKDGFPAYQLTSLVDDLYYGIDLIVRGEDLWPSTLAQHYLSETLSRGAFREVHFHHHPLLSGPEGEKLSKSAGATSIQYLRRRGAKPSDIYSLLAGMLGSPHARPGTWEELIALSPLSQESRGPE